MWQKGQSGNPQGRAREKPYRDAMRMELALIEAGEPSPAKPGSLRAIVRAQLLRAMDSEQSAQEVANRMDGKVPQALIGDDQEDPVSVRTIVTGVPRAGDA